MQAFSPRETVSELDRFIIGQDDAKLCHTLVQAPEDKGILSQLALEPQRIRSFEITYTYADLVS